MPNRIIRDAILSSERVASLGWAEEVMFRRLMSIVDDYGRHEAGHKLLRSKCYPLQTDDVSCEQVSKWLNTLQKAGLLTLYASGGKQYLELHNFNQQTRTPSKCPEPEIICAQVISNDRLGVVVSGDVVEGVSVTPIVPTGDEAAVLTAYHEMLPRCQSVSVLNTKRKRRIAAAVKLAKTVCQQQGWRYDPDDFWRSYFGECQGDAWLRGETPNPKNPSWRQNLDVLLAEDRFAGIMDRAIASARADA